MVGHEPYNAVREPWMTPEAFVSTHVDKFVPIVGDQRRHRAQGLFTGVGQLDGLSLAVLGHTDTLCVPADIAQAQRLLRLAERFRLPLLTLVHTNGVHPQPANDLPMWRAVGQLLESMLAFPQASVGLMMGPAISGTAVGMLACDVRLAVSGAWVSGLPPGVAAGIRSDDSLKGSSVDLGHAEMLEQGFARDWDGKPASVSEVFIELERLAIDRRVANRGRFRTKPKAKV